MTKNQPEPHHLLVVDDEADLREALNAYFTRQGFRVSEADGGAALREVVGREPVDLVLLDVNMPGDDGFTLARELRATSPVGIIMLTASGELVDRVVGLELGADDYVPKPFDPRELLARVRAVLRRRESGEQATGAAVPNAEDRVCFGDAVLDLGQHRLIGADGREIVLTALEYDLLAIFARNPERVFSRDELAALTHRGELSPFDRSIDMRVGRLRRKIEPDPRVPQIIKTVRAAGYVYVPPAR